MKKYAIAVDVGTTTVCFELIDLIKRKVVDIFSLSNGQSKYGLDVITRIKNANNGKLHLLRNAIINDIEKGILTLCKSDRCMLLQINEIAISGNTTMLHLLQGLNCESLGVYPFETVSIGLVRKCYVDVLGSDFLDCDVIIFPGVSAAIGADIVSGIFFCDLHKSSNVVMLIDIGTNGEIVLGNVDKILAVSTAAGPAFEGGNIFWGCTAIEGAIYLVEYFNNHFHAKTISEALPVGICGAGLIDIVAKCLLNGIIDYTGLIVDKNMTDGIVISETENKKILLTQRDIRELQLAKAAIRAGIEFIIDKFGMTNCCFDVLLAGSFGVNINIESAITIGLLPQQFNGRIKVIDNSSLGGVSKYLLNLNYMPCDDILMDISNSVLSMNLPLSDEFNDLFLSFIDFPIFPR